MKKILICLAAMAACSLSAQGADTLTVMMNDLDDVEVTAQRVRQTTSNHEVIEKEDLNRENTGQNLPYLLQMTPSLVTMSDDGLGIGYSYFRVRGTDHGRINMTMNDVPLNDSESQLVYWVNLTDMASGLSSVDVQRGVGTSTNGSASFGASVNMSTFVYDTCNHFTVGFNGGMYNTFREMVSAGVKLPNNFYATARFSKVNSDGFLYRAASDLYSYSGSFGYFTKKTEAYVELFGGKEKTYMAWDGVDYNTAYGLEGADRRYNPAGKYTDDEGNEAYYKNQNDNYWQQHVQLHWNQRWHPQWTTAVTLHYTHGGGYYEQYKENKKFTSIGLQSFVDADGNTHKKTDYIRLKNMNNHFFGGVASVKFTDEAANAQFGVAANHYIGDHFGNITWIRDSLYPYALPFDYEYYRNQGRKTDVNTYLKANWFIIHRAQERLTLYGDLQYRYVDYRIDGTNDEDRGDLAIHEQFHFFNPKAGLTYENHGHLLYGSFAIANREPNRKNYTEAGMHDIQKPERLYDYELGYSYSGLWGKNDKAWGVGLNLYFMDYDNQLVLTGKYSSTGAYLTKNVKDSYRMGAELTFGVEFTKWFRWDGTLTLSRNRILNHSDWYDAYQSDWSGGDSQVEVQLGNVDIAMSPSIVAGNLFTFNTHGFMATIQTSVVGKQYLDNTMSDEASLKPYSTTNLNLSYELPLPARCPSIRLLCQVNNIFNAKYASNGGNWACRFEDTNEFYHTPWFYAQAGINVHAGFVVNF